MGKISLVPTNLLLNQQQQQQQQQQAQQLQHKNFFMPSNMTTTITTSVGQSSVPGDHSSTTTMPMKVLLVNTVPKQSHPTQMSTSTPTIHHQNPNKAEIIPLPLDYPTSRLPSVNHYARAPAKHPVDVREEQLNRRRPRRIIKRIRPQSQTLAIPGLKTLLGNFIQTQQETNAINRERLELEKRVVDEFLGLMPILKGIAGQFLTSATTNHQQPTSTLHCNGHVSGGNVEMGLEGDEVEEEDVIEDESDT